MCKIVLLFSDDQAPYIETKPLHATQKTKIVDEGLLVTIEVIQNCELEKLILSFDENVKVIEPVSFSEVINDRLRNALGLYS